MPLGAKDIAAQTAELNRELRAAQRSCQQIIAQSSTITVRANTGRFGGAFAAGVPGGGAAAAQQMSGASAPGRRRRRKLPCGFQAYQRSVVAQDNAAASAISNQLQRQASQKYRAKAEQLHSTRPIFRYG